MMFRQGRYFMLLTKELSRKYKGALVFGFLLGLFGTLLFFHVTPLLVKRYFSPVTRIGLIGSYTPTTLPISIQNQISYGLTKEAPDGSAEPGLAYSWEISPDGKKYTFHLKSNIFWHTGKQVVARDINYNFRDVTFVPQDAKTLTATLKAAYSPFPTLLDKPIFSSGLVGFGSYKVESVRLHGDGIAFLRLEPMDKKEKTIEYRFYQTQVLAITAYKRGEIDKIEEIDAGNTLSKWVNTVVTTHQYYNQAVALFYSVKDPILSQRNFRLALSYAVPDFPEEPVHSLFSKFSWANGGIQRQFSYDEVQTKKLLKASNSASQSGALTLTTFSPLVSVADRIAKSWTSFGIPTKVKVVNDLSDGFQVLLAIQNFPQDPDQYIFWHSTQHSTNLTGYSNAKIDKLLEEGRKESDQEKRKKIYQDFAKRILDDAPIRLLYYPKTYTVERIHH